MSMKEHKTYSKIIEIIKLVYILWEEANSTQIKEQRHSNSKHNEHNKPKYGESSE